MLVVLDQDTPREIANYAVKVPETQPKNDSSTENEYIEDEVSRMQPN